MNYKKIYLSLVKKRLLNPAKNEFLYTENHHILPVSIYPLQLKNKKNIVNLSARLHFIAHALLVKYYKQKGDKQNHYKMMSAFTAMSQLWGSNRSNELRYKCGDRKSYLYQLWKEDLSKYIKLSGCRTGINSSNYNRKMIHNEKLKQIKYINKDEAIPEDWLEGQGSWLIKSGKLSATYNRVWCYDSKTNKQFYVKKLEVTLLLEKNSDIKLGITPTSKSHRQYYNPLLYNIWISNLLLKQFKLWPKDKEIPEGWLIGKVDNFDRYLLKYLLALKHLLAYFVNYLERLKNKCLPKIKLRKAPLKYHKHTGLNKDSTNIKKEKISLLEKINLLRDLYKVYCEKGFDRSCIAI